MKEKEISDDEIQILGLKYKKLETTYSSRKSKRWIITGILIAIVIIVASIVFIFHQNPNPKTIEKRSSAFHASISQEEAPSTGYIKLSNVTVNDVPLKIYTPMNAIPELTLSLPDETDSSIVFVTQAADIGENDFGIVGDFVMKGKVLAKGKSKEGFCSIINNNLTVGVGLETPLLQDAIREKGYFFRQYPLVNNLKAIFNKPKGKSIRRALAMRRDEIIMIESCDRESFHDFAQALADMGILEAIYLMGTASIYGWYIDDLGNQHFFGTKKDYYLEGENFLVWKKK